MIAVTDLLHMTNNGNAIGVTVLRDTVDREDSNQRHYRENRIAHCTPPLRSRKRPEIISPRSERNKRIFAITGSRARSRGSPPAERQDQLPPKMEHLLCCAAARCSSEARNGSETD